MKLKEAMELGMICGLETIEECLLNIELHATSLFAYSELNQELNELYEDLEEQHPDIFNKLYKRVEKDGVN